MLSSYAVRPAFKLDLTSVLFTSAASGASSKSSVTASSGLIETADTSDAVKLTVTDTTNLSLTSASLDKTSVKAGDEVKLTYAGATAGANNYVSCVLVDGNNKITHYAKLSQNTAESDLPLTLPSALAAGSYTLRVFNEQANADYYTDFASETKDIAIAVLSSDADLDTVLSQQVAPSGTGTLLSPKAASIDVAHSVAALAPADIVAAHAGATAELYSDDGFTTQVTTSLPLAEAASTHAYIKVTAQDGATVLYYDITVNRAAAPVLSHIITASAGANGSITPSGAVTVDDGQDQAFTITADAGFRIADIKVDGASVGKQSPYTFASVTQDHTIEATFEAIPSGCNYWLDGSDVYINGSKTNLVFVVDKDFTLFDHTEIDGHAVASSDVVVTSGSTKATIQATYLETLDTGSHTIELFFSDGTSASGTFQVKAATINGGNTVSNTKGSGTTTAKTGDSTPVTLAAIGALCALGALGLYRIRGRRKLSSAKHRH